MSSHAVKKVIFWSSDRLHSVAYERTWLQPREDTTAPLHIRYSSFKEKRVSGSREGHTLYSFAVGMKNFGKRRPGQTAIKIHLDNSSLSTAV